MTPPTHGRRGLLFVNADGQEVAAAQQSLLDSGVEVTGAANGQAAMALLHPPAASFDLVIVDACSRTLSAWELSLIVDVARRKGIPLIIHSARSPSEAVMASRLASGWLPKPFAPEACLACVLHALGPLDDPEGSGMSGFRAPPVVD
jgi:DNA-binding NtrC family response regulator